MNERYKKIISLLLAMVLILGMLPTEITYALPDDDSSNPAATATLTFAVQNATVLDANGSPIGDSYTGDIGSTLIFRVEPAEGFALPAVQVDGSDLPPDGENTYTVTLTADAQITVTCVSTDTEAPTVSIGNRPTDAWEKEVAYIITAADNNAVASVTVVDGAGQQAVVADNQDGTYAVTITANGTYTVTVLDTAGNPATATITEEKVDSTAPSITALEDQTAEGAAEKTYLLSVEDTQSGIAKAVLTVNEVETELVSANSDGSYTFTVPMDTSFAVTVTDAVGNENSQTVTVEPPAVPAVSVTRPDTAWHKEVTYTVTLVNSESTIASVTYAAEGEEPQNIEADLEGNYRFIVSANGTYTVTVTDATGASYPATITEDKIDGTVPTMTAPIRTGSGVSLTATYTFTAEDIDSGIASVTVTLGSGGTAEAILDAGTYFFTLGSNDTFTVTVTDVAGNSVTAEGEETLIDSTPPEIQELKRAESGWAQLAHYSFKLEDAQSGIKSVSVVVGTGRPQELTAVEGVYSFTVDTNTSFVITMSDNLGNVVSTSGTESMIDVTAPEIVDLHRTTDGWEYNSAYTFKVSDSQAGAGTVTIKLGDGAEQILLPNASDEYFFVVSENLDFTITVTDAAGNSNTANGTEDKIDSTDPDISEVIRVEDGWAHTATHKFTVSDSESGVASVTVRIGTGEPVTLTGTDGAYSFEMGTNETYLITVTDAAGNTVTKSGIENLADRAAPEISDPIRSKEGWQIGVEYTFTAVDHQSGIASVTVQQDDGQPQALTELDGKYTFAANANGTYIITVKDTCGNVTTKQIVENMVDIKAPEIISLTRHADGWAKTVTYTFRVTDNDQSGIKAVLLALGEGTAQPVEPHDGIYSFTLTENTAFTITAEDNLGQTSTADGKEEKLDNTAPVISVPVRQESGWAQESHYSFTVQEDQSGIGSVVVKYASGGEEVLTGNNGSYTFTMKANDSFSIVAVDAMGNTTATAGMETMTDPAAPTVSDLSRAESGWATSATYIFTASDDLSGIATVVYTIGGGQAVTLTEESGQYSFTVTENGPIVVTVTDKVGRVTTKEVSEDKVDTAAPMLAELTRAESGWATSATYTFTVADDLCGIEAVKLTITGKEPVTLTGKNGKYTFTLDANTDFQITAVDKVGNENSLSGAENRVDTGKPEIGTPARENDSWSYSAKYTVTLSDALSGIQSVRITAVGKEAQDLSPNGNGEYSFVITENAEYTITVTDMVGNTRKLSFAEDHVDTTTPIVSNIVRNPKGWAYTATVTFTAKDSLSGLASVMVFQGGEEVAVKDEGNGNYSFTCEANGNYDIVVTDIVGNQKAIIYAEGQVDQKTPTISNITPQADWHPSENKVTFTVSDESALDSVTVTDSYGKTYDVTALGGKKYEIILTVNGDYTVTAKDKAGNHTSKGFTVWHIDTEAPSIPKVESTADSWTNQEVTLTLTATDSQSGVVSFAYTTQKDLPYGEEGWIVVQLQDGKGSFTVDAEQDTTYYMVALDAVGRVSDKAEMLVQIDKTVPTELNGSFVTEDGSGFHAMSSDGKYLYKDKVQFQLSAIDPASGIQYYEYRLEYGKGIMTEWVKVPADGLCTVSGLNDEVYIVHFRATDVAGNTSSETTIQTNGSPAKFVLENTPADDNQRYPAPTVVMTVPNGSYDGTWTNMTVTATISGSAAVSGIARYEYRVDYTDPDKTDLGWQSLTMSNGESKLAVTEDTNATYYFRAVSHTGNASKEASAVVRVQKTLPNTGIITPEKATGTNGWHTKLPGYTVTLPEQAEYGAPVTYALRYTFNGGDSADKSYTDHPSVNIDKDGVWTLALVSFDSAGNICVGQTVTFRVDTKVPSGFSVTMDDGTNILNIGSSLVNWDQVNTADFILHSDAYQIFRNQTVYISAAADGGDSGLDMIYYQFTPSPDGYDPGGEWQQMRSGATPIFPNGKYNLYFKAVDKAGNEAYFSGRSILLDNTAPGGKNGTSVLTLTPDTSNRSQYGFYNSDVTVNITVADPTVGEGGAFAGLDTITYRVLADGEVTQRGTLYPQNGTAIELEGRVSSWSGTVVIEAQRNNAENVILEVTATDKAGNTKVTATNAHAIRMDLTAPELYASYDNNNAVSKFNDIMCFRTGRTLVFTITEKNFIPATSHINVVDVDTGVSSVISWNSNGDIHTATIPLVKDGNYKVSAVVTDAAGNKTETIVYAPNTVAPDRFIVDMTNPSIIVTHMDNGVSQEKYFNTDRTITVTVTEKNFSSNLINFKLKLVKEDGKTEYIPLGKWKHKDLIHTTSITLTEDGIYTLEVSGVDAVGNAAPLVPYIGTATQEWVIDKTLEAPTFDYVAEGGAYNNKLVPTITAVDWNLDNLILRLYHTTPEIVYEDVSSSYITENTMSKTAVEKGIKIGLDIFPEMQEYDGIYTLVATAVDKAGNRMESQVTFSVNRFGSIYLYDSVSAALLGQSMKKLDHSFTVTELNPSGIVEESAQVHITRDGMPIENPIFEMKEIQREDGWFEYQYIISKENFTSDGSYEVVISTEDSAGNFPENTAESNAMRFSIDNQLPELTSVIGMDDPIVNATELDVTLNIMDNVAIDTVIVYVDEAEAGRWEDIGSYETVCSFQIPEGMDHHVRVVIIDEAGNTLDTDSEDFNPGYDFPDSITVSPNIFLRIYANKPLFYGILILVILLLIILIILLWKKLRQEDEEPQPPTSAPPEEPKGPTPVESDAQNAETLHSPSLVPPTPPVSGESGENDKVPAPEKPPVVASPSGLDTGMDGGGDNAAEAAVPDIPVPPETPPPVVPKVEPLVANISPEIVTPPAPTPDLSEPISPAGEPICDPAGAERDTVRMNE